MSTVKQSETNGTDIRPNKPMINGLSAKLLILTVLFVMIGEVLIYVPSIANYRINWLNERLAAAQIASLVMEANPDNMVSPELQKELLVNAGAKMIALRRDQARHLMLGSGEGLTIERHYDVRAHLRMASIWDAFETLVTPGSRLIRIIGKPRQDGGEFIEIVINEQPLRAAMIRFSINILTLSLIISAVTASLVFLTLHWLLVRPMRRLTGSMVEFADSPEDTSRIISPSGRRDEIGVAERQLENMQRELAQTLQQKNRLAALGLAVSKISHDLRNMLASAQLLSDRLGSVNEPKVVNVAPKLIASLDRAIAFCADTLKFGRAQEAPPRRARFLMGPLVQDVFDDLKIHMDSKIEWLNQVPGDLEIDADRDHLFRILVNLSRNAAEAIMSQPDTKKGVIKLNTWRDGAVVTIAIEDNGPGLAARARENLFQAFTGNAKPGGTGLGLAIAAELVQAHGGDIEAVDVKIGTKFLITIPDHVAVVPLIRKQA